VRSILVITLLGAALLGQVPLPQEDVPPVPGTPDGGPVSPDPSPRQPLPPLKMETPPAEALVPPAKGPSPLVPVPPAGEPPAQSPQDKETPPAVRPPPFKLLDVPPSPESQPRPAPETVAVEPLPAGSVATPCLVLWRGGPVQARAGLPFTFEIAVRNAGSVPARQARLEEELPAGTRFLGAQPTPVLEGNRLSWNVEDLGPGAERRFRVEVVTDEGGDWAAQASLTVSVAAVQQAHVAAAPARLLEVTTPAPARVGQLVPVPVRIINTTGSPLTDLVLRVHLGAGLQHLQGDVIEGPLGDLAAGQTRSLTLETIATQAGNLTARLTLLSGKKGLATFALGVPVAEQTGLALRAVPLPLPTQGGEGEYRVEVTNRGTVELRDVVIRDTLPPELTFRNGPGAAYDPATHTVTWNLGALPAGQSRQVSFRGLLAQGPRLNRIVARSGDGQETQLHTVLRVVPR
jgi:uncharacterized repeat protein (TIGR01451 family)